MLLLIFLHTPSPKAPPLSFMQQVRMYDPLGSMLLLPSLVCLLLALEWGGVLYAWNDWRLVVLLVFFVVSVGRGWFCSSRTPLCAPVPPGRWSVAFESEQCD